MVDHTDGLVEDMNLDQKQPPNYERKDPEQSEITGPLNRVEQAIQSMDEGITHLHSPERNVRDCGAEGVSRIDHLRSAYTRIPTEIWSDIFTYCIDSSLLYLPPIPNQPIWKVMAVCSRWRQIVLAEPRIWNKLRADDRKNAMYMNELVLEIFARRGGGGMIKYWAPCINNNHTWNDFIALISAYPSRLQHLWLEFRNFFPPSTTAPIDLENLESISFHFSWQDSYDTHAIPATGFLTFKNLQRVSLFMKKTALPSAWPARISLPWTQLTDLSVGVVSVSMIGPALSQCTQLVKCSIHMKGELASQNISNYPIELVHLDSLSFMIYSDFLGAKSLMDVLVVPKLKDLSLGSQHWDTWPQTSVLQLIERSACALEILRTPDLVLENVHLIELLRATPHLIELFTYTRDYISDATITTILRENLGPRLRVLDGLRVQFLGPFVELVRSRCLATRDGNVVGGGILEGCVGVPEDHVDLDYHKAVLERLRDFGVDIEVYPTSD